MQGLISALLLVAGSFAVAASASPQTVPEPTQRYRVMQVEADDRLNVREQPDPSANVVATLAPDAGGVIVSGSHADMGKGEWWQVVTGEGTGWVNARFLAADGDENDERETFPLLCLGTEPFWSLAVEEGEAAFEPAFEDGQTWQAGPMTYANGLLGRFAIQLREEAAVGHVAAWRNRNSCSDGMSDIGYPYEGIVVTPDGTVYGGCCRRAG